MFSTIISLALLPAAIATVISLIAVVFLVIYSAWRLIIFVAVSFVSFLIFLATNNNFYVGFGLFFVSLMVLLWAIEDRKTSFRTEHLEG